MAKRIDGMLCPECGLPMVKRKNHPTHFECTTEGCSVIKIQNGRVLIDCLSVKE